MMKNREHRTDDESGRPETGSPFPLPTSHFPSPVEEIKGLSKWRNGNGFYITRVHYTADPNKDPDTPEGREWYTLARRGMPETSWRKEYEIDWFARSGQLVYPQFKREVHVIKPFKIPDDWTRYMAIDPGLRNPTACLWGAIDKDDTIIIYDEYYVTGQIIRDHCGAIRQREGDDKIFLRLIDPSASGRNMINNRSNKEEFAKFKIYCIPAKNSLEPGINRVSQYLKLEKGDGKRETDPDTVKPGIYFFSNLTNTIKEITNYRWEEIDRESANKRNPPERPVKRNDHLMDCLRYIIMADPHYVKETEIPPYKPHTSWEGMTTGY
ncbi:MAG: hypothetical protein K8T10_16140 [Candidatus Eremiobacteraeota bacterium]|nr:hypothetical protein [Candidatus Eremiobacteraeota bacterium]